MDTTERDEFMNGVVLRVRASAQIMVECIECGDWLKATAAAQDLDVMIGQRSPIDDMMGNQRGYVVNGFLHAGSEDGLFIGDGPTQEQISAAIARYNENLTALVPTIGPGDPHEPCAHCGQVHGEHENDDRMREGEIGSLAEFLDFLAQGEGE